MKKQILFIIVLSLMNGKIFSQNWELVFSDDFEEVGEPNKTKWTYCKRRSSDWNKYMKNSEENVFVKDGKLFLRAIKNNDMSSDNVPYFTGGIESRNKFSFKYGKIEVRAKLTKGQGSWPAIWLMPQDGTGGWPKCGEIDIMEHLNKDNFCYQTIHSHYHNTLKKKIPKKHSTAKINPEEFTTFGLCWYSDRLEWYINGKRTFTYHNINAVPELLQYPFKKEFYIILNQAAGGSWGGAVTDAELPFQMEIDWVKVYKLSVFSAPNYYIPDWSGIKPQNDILWKNTFLKKASTKGAYKNLEYSAEKRPDPFYYLHNDTIEVEKGKQFNLNLEAFSLGEYNTEKVLQDLRYTCAYIYLDSDNDGTFETELEQTGKIQPDNDIGGNYDVLNICRTIKIPKDVKTAVGRIRVVYHNAWSRHLTANSEVKEGLCYDFPIKIIPLQIPIVNFSADKTIIETGEAVNFIDMTTNSPTAWQWTFEGAETSESTVPNPKGIKYNKEGRFNVTLDVSNSSASNTLTKQEYIIVKKTSSINTIQKQYEYNICYNETEMQLYVNIAEGENIPVSIFNISGKLIWEERANKGENIYPLELKKDIYLVRIKLRDREIVKKILIK